jgi:PAS domain S-box-containing protein
MQRDRLIRLLDHCRDAAFALTREGEIWSWNRPAERLFGYTSEQAVNQQFTELLRPRGLLGKTIDEEYCRIAIREGHVASFDMLVTIRSGRELWVSATVLVFEALRASPPVIAHIAHDITLAKEREALATQLLETARRMVALTDDVGRLGPVVPLSEQEQRILHAFLEGKQAREISAQLKISAQTLRNHLHHINRKLGTHNRLEAVTHAIRRKLI